MINIIKQKLREQFKSVVYYLIGLLCYAWMLLAMFPTMEKIDLSAYPEEFLKFFGSDNISSISTIEGFLSMEFLSLFFVLIISFYVAASAGSAIAGAIEKKTMDFQLSQPISRTKLVISESVVILLYSVLLVSFTSLSIFLFCKAYDVQISNNGLLSFSLIAILLIWAIYGIAIFISSILRSKITVAATTVFTVMALYILTAMSNIFEKLKDFDKFSLFYLYNPEKLLRDGFVDWNHVLILSAIMVCGLLGSLIIFNKKDI